METEIHEVYDTEAAKNKLGHASKTVTERHYLNRKVVVPDYRAATERLASGSGQATALGPERPLGLRIGATEFTSPLRAPSVGPLRASGPRCRPTQGPTWSRIRSRPSSKRAQCEP